MMTSIQVVKTSITDTDNIPSQGYPSFMQTLLILHSQTSSEIQ